MFAVLSGEGFQWCLGNGGRRRPVRAPSRLAPMLRVVLALWVGFAGVQSARADGPDTVRLQDGSVLRGEILRVEEDEMVIDTEYADEVTVGVEHIVEIESAQRFTVRLADGEKVTGTLFVSPDRKLVIRDTQTVEGLGEPTPSEAPMALEGEPVVEPLVVGTAVEFDDVYWIKQEAPYLRFKGNLNVGAQASRGNTDTTDMHLDALIKPSFGWNTIELSGEYDKKEAEGETTADRWRTQGRYERDIGERWLATALNSYEQDKKRDLDLRVVAGAGVGYKFFDDAPMYLKVYPSVAYVIENFSGETGDREFPGFVWNLDFKRDLYKDDVAFYHNHQVIDSFEKLSNFTALTKTGFELDLFGDLVLSTELQYDWNNAPAEGNDEDDLRYILKIGYKFEGDENDWWQ